MESLHEVFRSGKYESSLLSLQIFHWLSMEKFLSVRKAIIRLYIGKEVSIFSSTILWASFYIFSLPLPVWDFYTGSAYLDWRNISCWFQECALKKWVTTETGTVMDLNYSVINLSNSAASLQFWLKNDKFKNYSFEYKSMCYACLMMVILYVMFSEIICNKKNILIHQRTLQNSWDNCISIAYPVKT